MEVKHPMHWHPIACIFPMLSESELLDLAADIAKYGQCFESFIRSNCTMSESRDTNFCQQ
jgi:hypothetical protein